MCVEELFKQILLNQWKLKFGELKIILFIKFLGLLLMKCLGILY